MLLSMMTTLCHHGDSCQVLGTSVGIDIYLPCFWSQVCHISDIRSRSCTGWNMSHASLLKQSTLLFNMLVPGTAGLVLEFDFDQPWFDRLV